MQRRPAIPLALAGAVVSTSAALASVPAFAEPSERPQVALEVLTDDRRRGLSWSDGEVAAQASLSVPVGYDFSIDASATTLRGSARHGGADLGIAVRPRLALAQGSGWELGVGAAGHAFVGAGSLGYGEVTLDAGYSLGPARVGAFVAYAPRQSAIGGSNLYVRADASVGIPGTPLTILGSVGRTSGSSDGPRAARLRPGGHYMDYALALEHASGPLSFGLRYSDTTIARAEIDRQSPFRDAHYGARLAAYLRWSP